MNSAGHPEEISIMTQEERQLLIKDLCTRLPYGVICRISVKGADVSITEKLELGGLVHFISGTMDVKPYLRSMSSMTEEEKEEIAFIRDRDFQSVRKWVHGESIKETGNICPISCGEIDYCNKKHLDYRGLIKKGLALEAPEGMYK